MVPESFHEFFLATAGAAAALIGLLFVAVSVAPERINGPKASVIEQTRASSALTCFVVPLALALVALLPGAHVSIPAIILSAAGLLFAAAATRRYFSAPRANRENIRGLVGLIGFVAALGVVLGYGVVDAVDPADGNAIDAIAGATIALVLLGVERAWALIGGRDTGRASALRDLIVGEAGRADENDRER